MIIIIQLNDYAIPLNAWIHKEDICRMTGVILSIWRDHGERNQRPKGRFRFFLNKIGIIEFRNLVEKEFGTLIEDPGSEFNQAPKSVLGIHKQKQENLEFSQPFHN